MKKKKSKETMFKLEYVMCFAGKGNDILLQYSCLRNPMARVAGRL